jgi:hypothetical protein
MMLMEYWYKTMNSPALAVVGCLPLSLVVDDVGAVLALLCGGSDEPDELVDGRSGDDVANMSNDSKLPNTTVWLFVAAAANTDASGWGRTVAGVTLLFATATWGVGVATVATGVEALATGAVGNGRVALLVRRGIGGGGADDAIIEGVVDARWANDAPVGVDANVGVDDAGAAVVAPPTDDNDDVDGGWVGSTTIFDDGGIANGRGGLEAYGSENGDGGGTSLNVDDGDGAPPSTARGVTVCDTDADADPPNAIFDGVTDADPGGDDDGIVSNDGATFGISCSLAGVATAADDDDDTAGDVIIIDGVLKPLATTGPEPVICRCNAIYCWMPRIHAYEQMSQ